MNVTDRAFIKAYAWDRAEPTPPAPHLQFAPARPATQSGHASQQLSGNQEKFAAAHAQSATQSPQPPRKPAASALPPSLTRAAANVTHYVPAPHMPLAGTQSSRATERTPLHLSSQVSDNPSANTPSNQQSSSPIASPTKSSQPLSSFTQEEPVVEAFEPAFGVASFQWPETCERLGHFAPPDYSELYAAFAERTDGTAQVIAVTGARRGEGRSTALLCIGQESAKRGLRTVMVDGDFARPSLAEQLCLVTSTGWEDVLSGQILLAEAVIYSEAEGLALLPLGETVRDRHATASSLHVAISLAVLSQHYDLVLVDVGPLCQEPSAAGTLLRRAKFTGALLVQDARQDSETTLASALHRLDELSVPLVGVIENFGAMNDFTTTNDQRRTSAA